MGEGLGFIGWIVLGGLAGWVASIIMKTNKDQGLMGNIFIGIVGGFIGGLLFNLIGGEGVTGFNFWSFGVAVVGAVLLIWVWGLMTGSKK